MRVLYGIQGTGNGHISRARFIYRYLQKISNDIDILVSGNNYHLNVNIPIKYKPLGLTFYVKNGRIDYLKTVTKFNFIKFYNEQKKIQFKDYDLVITDFEPISAWNAYRYNIPSIHISHQASFINNNVPRTQYKSIIGECIMKYFCPSNQFIGLHYKKYSPNISEPIIDPSITNRSFSELNHVTVYLPWYNDNYLYTFFKVIKDFKFHIFSKNISSKKEIKNICFFPINQYLFSNSLADSYGVICNAGFQTSAEVLSIGKRLLVIPIIGQYEQQCNVVALNEIGIQSIDYLDIKSRIKVINWLKSNPIKLYFSNNVDELLERKINKVM